MFQLTEAEVSALRSQIATSKTGRGGRRYRPYAFTEHGTIMAAKLNEFESRLQDHVGQIGAIRSLMAEPRARRKPTIGYHTEVRPERVKRPRK